MATKHLIGPDAEELIGAAVDITAPNVVEVKVRDDGRVLWVNVDGICALRVCMIPHIVIDVAGHISEYGQEST